MSSPSIYRPDWSLPLAVSVLVGGSLLAAGIFYLLTISAENPAGPHQPRLAESQSQGHARSAAPATRSGAQSGVPRQTRSPAPTFGGVPAWAGSGAPAVPPRSPTGNAYDLRPDMSHAELGSPSGGVDPGRSNAGAARTGVESSLDRGPDAGSAPRVADLGTRSSSASSGGGPEWRSEASELGRQARALSGALAHLDRSGRSKNANPRSDGTNSPTDGDASTAGANRGSRAAANTPDPPPPPPEVPVDGGLGWLAAAGAAYAANRLRKRRETDEPADEA